MNKLISLMLIISVDWLMKLTEYFEIYIFRDWGYAKYLIILVFIDTVMGMYRAKKHSKFSWKKLDALVDKAISYTSILILIHVITSFTVDNEVVTIFHWTRITVFSALMVKESYSILRNIAAIHEGYVPAWLLEKFKNFDKTGKFDATEFKIKKQDEDEK